MRSITLRLFGTVLVILLASCGGGGGGGTPTTPSTPTPVPVANVAGTWSGTYTITACGQSGAFSSADWCGNLGYGSNAPLPMTLVLTQSASSVSGTLAQGGIITPVTGTVDTSSHLFISGSMVYNSTILIETVGWNTTVTGSTMSGSWNMKASISGGGSAQSVNTLGVVGKSSRGDGVVIRLTRQPTTLQDVLDALRAQ